MTNPSTHRLRLILLLLFVLLRLRRASRNDDRGSVQCGTLKCRATDQAAALDILEWEQAATGPMLLLAPYGTNRVKKTNNWDNCEAADKMNNLSQCVEDMWETAAQSELSVSITWSVQHIDSCPPLCICLYEQWGSASLSSNYGSTPPQEI